MLYTNELSQFSDAKLADLLVLFTDIYSSILTDTDYNGEEYLECKDMIRQVQEEINVRRTTPH